LVLHDLDKLNFDMCCLKHKNREQMIQQEEK
jgi:hypothetical protein